MSELKSRHKSHTAYFATFVGAFISYDRFLMTRAKKARDLDATEEHRNVGALPSRPLRPSISLTRAFGDVTVTLRAPWGQRISPHWQLPAWPYQSRWQAARSELGVGPGPSLGGPDVDMPLLQSAPAGVQSKMSVSAALETFCGG